MKTLAELLDAAKTASDIPSDYALAKSLEITTANMSSIRSGRRWPARRHIPILADMIGMEHAELFAVIEVMKTGDIDLIASAERMLQKLHSKAAGIGGFCLGFQVLSEVANAPLYILCQIVKTTEIANLSRPWRCEFPDLSQNPAR